MALLAQIGTVVLSVGLGGLVSYCVSKKIAAETAEKQYEMENRRNRLNWYKQTSKLAARTEDDWWEVMNRGEAKYEVNATEIFTTRRDKLREQAAEGETLNVNFDTTQDLNQLAAEIDLALNKLDSGGELAEIEKRLLPIVDDLDSKAEKKTQDLS